MIYTTVIQLLLKTINTLWKYKAWVLVGILSATTYYYYSMLKFEKWQHTNTIVEYESKMKDISNAYLNNVVEVQQKYLDQYNNVQAKLNEIQEQQSVKNKDIDVLYDSISGNVGRLSEAIKRTPNSDSNSNTASDESHTKHANSVQWIKQPTIVDCSVSTECISEYQKMGRYADQERVAKETLQDSWKVIQSEYNK